MVRKTKDWRSTALTRKKENSPFCLLCRWLPRPAAHPIPVTVHGWGKTAAPWKKQPTVQHEGTSLKSHSKKGDKSGSVGRNGKGAACPPTPGCSLWCTRSPSQEASSRRSCSAHWSCSCPATSGATCRSCDASVATPSGETVAEQETDKRAHSDTAPPTSQMHLALHKKKSSNLLS